jgi:hypothetical protein
MRDRVARRREDRKRELEHQSWLATQKRELVSLRLQRAVARVEASPHSNRAMADRLQSERTYDPEAGVIVAWDYITGLPLTSGDVRLTHAVYEGKIQRTPFKVAMAKESEPYGPKHKRCVLLATHTLPQLPVSADLRLVVEVCEVLAIFLLPWSNSAVDLARSCTAQFNRSISCCNARLDSVGALSKARRSTHSTRWILQTPTRGFVHA